MKSQQIIASLITTLGVFVALWLTMSPVSAGVMREHVQQYVEITVERRLEGIEQQLSEMNQRLGELRESVARMEGRLTTRPE